jgi:rSAM/selenodomain-associated transferase 2
VSVVIPTWREEDSIGRCLESVLANDGPIEVIVSDAGSDDRTIEIARTYSGVRVLQNVPRGRGTQMNAGADVARGAFLWFVHADSVVPPEGARAVRETLSEPGVPGGAFRFAVDSPRKRFRVLEGIVRARSERFGFPYGDQGLFVRAETFDEIGRFREEPILEDLHLVRALRLRGRVRVREEAIRTSPRRWDRQGFTRTSLRNFAVLVCERLGVSPDRIAHLRRHVRR